MSMLNGLSIDLEDWYQGLTSTSRRFEEWSQFEERILDSTAHLLDILSTFDVRATFFVLGHVAEHHPQLVEEIHSRGHEIATHGYKHRLVYEMTPDEFRQDVDHSVRLLQDIASTVVCGYRAPAFSIDERSSWALEILEDLGLRYDSSIVPTKNPLYGWPGARSFPHRAPLSRDLMELPCSTLRIGRWNVPVGGGFYIRAYPLWFTRWAVKKINAKGQPAILYFHSWEFDPSHPQPATVTLRERLSHYHNLQTTETKFRSLLQTFHFAPLARLLETMPRAAK